MDKSSIIGLILALVALLTGMVMKGVSLSAFYNPAAILIIIWYYFRSNNCLSYAGVKACAKAI